MSPASKPLDHAPRAYGLMVGGSYAFRSRLPLSQRPDVHPLGVFAGVRFGWQVRGLAGGAPATVGFETDFIYQSAHDARNSYGLRYGIFAKHALAARLRVRPYFCYGLGAAQIWVRGIEGRGIGHATRLGFGVDVSTHERVHASLALTYEAIIMPRFALDAGGSRDTSFHALLLSTGVWFGQ